MAHVLLMMGMIYGAVFTMAPPVAGGQVVSNCNCPSKADCAFLDHQSTDLARALGPNSAYTQVRSLCQMS